MEGQGNLERTLEVREKSGNLNMATVVFRTYTYSVQEEECTF